MKLAVIRKRVTPAGAADSEATSDVEVPGSALAAVSGILTALMTLSQILGNVVSHYTNLTGGRAQTELVRERGDLVEANFRAQLLQRVLGDADEAKTDEEKAKKRLQSLKLLLYSGLLADPDGKLERLLNDANFKAPQWKTQTLEPLKDTLALMGGGAPQQRQQQSAPGSQVTDGGSKDGTQTGAGNANGSGSTTPGTNTNTSSAGGNTSSQ